MVTSVTSEAGINYISGVKPQMNTASYWSARQKDKNKVLLSMKQIHALNARIRREKASNMTDLKKVAPYLNGVLVSQKLYEAAAKETNGFVGRKYDANGALTEADYYTDMVENCRNPAATENQPVQYGIAVKETNLLAYPTDKAILDDPGDNDFDNLFLSSLRVNEPVVIRSVSADGNYFHVWSGCCSGWVAAGDVAVCADRSEWLAGWDIPDRKVLVVYGSRISTEDSRTSPEVAGRRLNMGTTLELVSGKARGSLVTNRSTYHNYVVYLPVRNADGSYVKKPALISQHKKVSEGYLPLTKENISRVAFAMLGDVYGWGGMLGSEDCSGYVRGVYRCFGLELARNTTWQSAMPVRKYDVTEYSKKKKEALLDRLPLGSILFFPGHEMLYLGKAGKRYYVIDSVSSIIQPGTNRVQRVRGVIINPLDVRRRNGNAWMDELTTMLVPFESK